MIKVFGSGLRWKKLISYLSEDDYDKDDEDKNVSKNVAQASHLSSHCYGVLVLSVFCF